MPLLFFKIEQKIFSKPGLSQTMTLAPCQEEWITPLTESLRKGRVYKPRNGGDVLNENQPVAVVVCHKHFYVKTLYQEPGGPNWPDHTHHLELQGLQGSSYLYFIMMSGGSRVALSQEMFSRVSRAPLLEVAFTGQELQMSPVTYAEFSHKLQEANKIIQESKVGGLEKKFQELKYGDHEARLHKWATGVMCTNFGLAVVSQIEPLFREKAMRDFNFRPANITPGNMHCLKVVFDYSPLTKQRFMEAKELPAVLKSVQDNWKELEAGLIEEFALNGKDFDAHSPLSKLCNRLKDTCLGEEGRIVGHVQVGSK